MKEFVLTEKQMAMFEEWRKTKPRCSEEMVGIGGRFSFEFTPTGVGTIMKVKCNRDNDWLDLTDYDNF